ncbi:guanylate kinase [Paenibacillus frigoriresistens]|uniref:guanylate kinase n=1 Tax=Paenibacillus alginolyticus TaxID=59839 RepID=UPI001565619F|nr:guanylate kinase [Paenibacillus frigoriresistens]NRF90369.1 guanylate kinase [Paenibacillus frigoriresistens]
MVTCRDCIKVKGQGRRGDSWICNDCRVEVNVEVLNQSVNIFIFTGPEGARHPEVAEIVGSTLGISQVVPYTTRPRRENEEDGQYAVFVSPAVFNDAQDRGEFLCVSESYGHHYGIKYDDMERMIGTEQNVCLFADCSGADLVKEKYGDSVVRVYIDEVGHESSSDRWSTEYKTNCEYVFLNVDFPYLMFDLTNKLQSYLSLEWVEDF